LLGTDVTGTTVFGFSSVRVDLLAAVGIFEAAHHNRIGTNSDGTNDAEERNIITGSVYLDVTILGTGTAYNTVAGNYLGTNGTGALGTGTSVGIFEGASNNIIGGTTAAARNVIVGASNGVLIQNEGTNYNRVMGNYIGLNPAGTGLLATRDHGVWVRLGAKYNVIGGDDDDDGVLDGIVQARNVISGNATGIGLSYGGADGNQVLGNYIGTDAAGTTLLGNTRDGVIIEGGAKNNVIGGITAGAGNLIRGNGRAGVMVIDTGTTGNAIRGNQIIGNNGLSIDLGNDGVTGIDDLDADNAPNQLQNYPMLTTVVGGASTQVSGTLRSAASTTYTLDFYASSVPNAAGHYVDQRRLGSGTVTTDAGGIGLFNSATFPTPLGASSASEWITATATDPAGNTSEFAFDVQVDTSRDHTYTVVYSNERGAGSLRQAIHWGNVNPGDDFIRFNISGTGVKTITPLTPLPAITETLTIDGYSQPGASPNTNPIQPGLSGSALTTTLLIELNGMSAGGSGLVIQASSCIVQGLFINGVSGNGPAGVVITGAAATGNVVAGNSIATPNGSYVGVQIQAGAGNNTIGGSTPAARNLIWRNGPNIGSTSIGVNLDSAGAGNKIQGNVIDSQTMHGVQIANTADTTVGGTEAGAGNFITGNSFNGVIISGLSATGNLVQGNIIGDVITPMNVITSGNGGGVRITGGAHHNTIGGTTDAARNYISGNFRNGIGIDGNGTSYNTVLGNYIGTDLTGMLPRRNANLPPGTAGVRISGGASNNTIGGPTASARNVISGNGLALEVADSGTNDNKVLGNYIGVGADGVTNLGNVYGGVNIIGGTGTVVGGDATGQGNLICFNGNRGVRIAGNSTTGNSILGNAIYDNELLGIDLGGDGFTANDASDGDIGPNNLQNFPVLSAAHTGATTRIVGTLNSLANATFRLEFFANANPDPSGYGEGQRYLGFTNVTTDGSGNANFDAIVTGATAATEWVTATATLLVNGVSRDTSEFSLAVLVNQSPTAEANGPYSVPEDGSVVLSSAGSVDPDGTIVTYEWDFNYNGISFDVDATGTAPTFSAAGLSPNSRTVAVRVTDNRGGYAIDTATLNILNLVDVSGRVFDDRDNDGAYEPGDGDTGIGGVTVQLFAESSGTLIATRTTAADGTFFFDVNLGAGTYTLVTAQPTGFLDGRETAGNLGGIVDNSQDSNQITGIVVGEPGTTADAIDYLFAEIRPSQMLGMVWSDADNDGQIDFGELAIAGTTIELTGVDDRGAAVTRSAITDSSGIYAFTNLRPSGAGGYTIHELQPSDFVDGLDALGTVNGTAVGSNSVNDTFSGVVMSQPGSLAENYNFGERPPGGGSISSGETATIGFWQNNNGQNLIKALNGGSSATNLANWLAATFPNMYGTSAGASNLTGKTNAQVAEFYKSRFALHGQTSLGGGPPKMDAQVLATALAVYVTSQSLAGTAATAYGFHVTTDGVGVRMFNVGSNGAAFGVANNSNVSVLDLLLAVNSRSRNGLLYDLDGDGDANDALETSYRTMANNIFSAINEAGDI
jgi:hypothetical protein